MPEPGGNENIIIITDTDLSPVSAEEPEIIITEKDLLKNPPTIIVNHRDTGSNFRGWLAGALKDAKSKLTQISSDLRWWGNGELGKRKASENQKIEAERAEFEDLIHQIVISEDDQWKEIAENEIGEIEIKILEEKAPPQEESFSISEDEIDKLIIEEERLSPEEKRRRAQEHIERTTQIRKELFEAQAQAIAELYKERTYQTPIIMEHHRLQQYRGPIWSCAIASTLNCLYALKANRNGDNEDGIIQEMGGRTIFNSDGYLNRMGHVYQFLTQRGLYVKESGSMLELLQTLENNGVAILAYGGHARMISGAEVINGNVLIREHDPLLSEPNVKRIPLTEYMERINQSRSYSNLYLVENPNPTN